MEKVGNLGQVIQGKMGCVFVLLIAVSQEPRAVPGT